jgi:hypothetical protein
LRRPQQQQQPFKKKRQQQQQQSQQGSKQRRRRAARRRYAAAQQQRKRFKQRKQVPESPVCPPAPFNSNEYLMGCYEQHCAAQQAEQAATAQLAHAAAAHRTDAAADWGYKLSAQTAVAAYGVDDEAPSSPVCPPAPRLDNEFYMARFEQQLAAAAPVVVVEAGVAEWDPLLQEVTTFQHSTASSVPACMSAPTDDACSRSN